MGEHYRGEASFIEDAVIAWSKEPSSIEPHLEEALFEELCNDDVVVGAAPSVGHIDSICNELLDLTLFHPLYFPPLPLFFMHFMSP